MSLREDGDSVLFWKTWAEELQRELQEARRRLLFLASLLPPDYLFYLDSAMDLVTLRDPDPLDFWTETYQPASSDIVRELTELWRSLEERPSD